MKVGDIVEIRDSSYALLISQKGLVHTSMLSTEGKCKIISLNCDLPADTDRLSTGEVNDAIVIGLSSGRVIFTQERFLAPVLLPEPRFCPSCGAKLKKCDC